MKTTKLFATIAFTGLLTIAGGASAGNDAYSNAFFGDSGNRAPQHATTPQPAMSAGRNTAADGHESYNRAIAGISGQKPQVMTTGKAAYGTIQSTADGHAAYANAFHGD